MKNMCFGYYSFFVNKPFQDKHCIEFDLDENHVVRERETYCLYNGIHCMKVQDHIIFKKLSKLFRTCSVCLLILN